MLTHTDIHYVVGLLSRAASPDGVEVELGSRVYDDAAEKERDVDVTITMRSPGGTITAVSGIEVKDHTRPLTVEHAEQLCAKLKDLPQITTRAIASASGFTSAAIKKAQAHGVEVWELVDWDKACMRFANLALSPDFNMTEMRFEWVGKPRVEFKLQGTAPLGLRTTPKHPIQSENGSQIEGCPDIDSLAAAIVSRLPSEIGHKHLSEALSETQCPVDLSIQVPENPQICIGDDHFNITPAHVVGIIRKRERPIKEYLKVLRRHGDEELIGGCLVYEDGEGALMGLVITSKEQNVTLVRIPISERNKRKLLRVRLEDAGSVTCVERR